MRKMIKSFFVKHESLLQVRTVDLKDFFYEFTNFEISNPNQWYLFKQQITYFLIKINSRIYQIDWKRVEKIFKERKWKYE